MRGWEPYRKLILESSNEEKVLVSDERLCGVFNGGDWLGDFTRNVGNIHRHFENPAIIIGFRRHDSMLLSLYKQYLQQGGTGTIDSLYDSKNDSGIIKKRDICFRRRLEFLEERFGRIFVYTQEEMAENLDELAEEMAEFAGAKPPADFRSISESRKNVGLRGVFHARLLRRLNRLEKRLEDFSWTPSLNNSLFRKLWITPRRLCQDRLSRVESDPIKLPEELRNYLRNAYQEDWQCVLRKKERRLP